MCNISGEKNYFEFHISGKSFQFLIRSRPSIQKQFFFSSVKKLVLNKIKKNEQNNGFAR